MGCQPWRFSARQLAGERLAVQFPQLLIIAVRARSDKRELTLSLFVIHYLVDSGGDPTAKEVTDD